MKAFLSWLIAAVVGYGALGGGYHYYLSSNPKKIAVVVDSSFTMKDVWGDVPGLLDMLDDEKYATFVLMTEKRLIHDWDKSLNWIKLSPYAPRDLSKLKNFAELKEAAEVYLVTNAKPQELRDFADLKIIRGPGW